MVCRTVPWTERPLRCRILVRFELFDPILYGAQTLILVQAVRFPCPKVLIIFQQVTPHYTVPKPCPGLEGFVLAYFSVLSTVRNGA